MPPTPDCIPILGEELHLIPKSTAGILYMIWNHLYNESRVLHMALHHIIQIKFHVELNLNNMYCSH